MEFSVKLAGWVLDDPIFHLKKKKKKEVLIWFILPEKHLKANLFFPNLAPLNQPHHSPSRLLGLGYQEGWRGSYKGEKNKLTLKFILGDFKHF